MHQVRRRHVDLRAQHALAVLELAAPHALEQVEVLGDAARAVRAVAARLGQRAAARGDLLRGQVADVGLALLDQLHRERVELVEVVGREVLVLAPVEAEPAHVAP